MNENKKELAANDLHFVIPAVSSQPVEMKMKKVRIIVADMAVQVVVRFGKNKSNLMWSFRFVILINGHCGMQRLNGKIGMIGNGAVTIDACRKKKNDDGKKEA